MAETLVVKEGLSTAMQRAGAALTQRLDDGGWPVVASLWLYLPEANRWRLMLASPQVGQDGPKAAYEAVQQVLSSVPGEEPEPRIALQDVAVVDPSDPLISLLREAIGTGDGISGIRFSQNVINGHLIEDAYIYRMK